VQALAKIKGTVKILLNLDSMLGADEEIVTLARQITGQKASADDKVAALLAWFADNKNFRSKNLLSQIDRRTANGSVPICPDSGRFVAQAGIFDVARTNPSRSWLQAIVQSRQPKSVSSHVEVTVISSLIWAASPITRFVPCSQSCF
jgi:hypothetical protein